MFITKKHISRRTLLRGAGTALALPLLDAMIPAFTAQAKSPAKTPPRFFGGFVPHGAAPGYWIPEKVGALPDELPFIWKPMEPFRKHLNILTGLHSRSSEPPPGETGADHWVAAAFLCAQKPRKTAGADVYAGQTHRPDHRRQVRAGNAAAVGGNFGGRPGIGFEQLRRRLQLRLYQHDRLGFAHHAIADGAEPAGGVRAHVRQRQHGRAARAAPPAQPEHPRFGQRQDQGRAQRDQRRGQGAPGCLHRERARDRASVADCRQRHRSRAPRDFAVPPGIPQSFDQHIKIMFDLLVLGYQADITRVGTMLFARDLTGPRLSGKRVADAGFPWWFAPRRRPEPDQPALEDQPVSREDAGLFRREAGQHQ
jgi:hypothetical protein